MKGEEAAVHARAREMPPPRLAGAARVGPAAPLACLHACKAPVARGQRWLLSPFQKQLRLLNCGGGKLEVVV